ncbi:cell division protein FtsL [Mucilaginibacter sp. OAE612]
MKQQLSINYQNIKLSNAIKSIENRILKLNAERLKLKANKPANPTANCYSL